MTNIEMNLAKQLCLQIYRSQRYSSEDRNHEQPSYTSEELLQWLYKQENFHKIIKDYIDNSFKSKFLPSIDRLDNKEPYTMSNIQLLTWGEHSKLPSSHNAKRIIQYNEAGEFEVFDSSAAAARELYLSSSNITKACRYGNKAYGYFWSYYD